MTSPLWTKIKQENKNENSSDNTEKPGAFAHQCESLPLLATLWQDVGKTYWQNMLARDIDNTCYQKMLARHFGKTC
jgi:hypothetical protein